MRLEAFDFPAGIVIRLGEVSVSLDVAEVKGKGLQETCLILCDKLERVANLREKDDGSPEVFELRGDEEDVDMSLYSLEVDVDW